MVAWLAVRRSDAGHVRPLNPYRDLESLATLIEIAFGSELALTGSSMVRDLRQYALLGPVLRVAHTIAPVFSGYVWIEDEKLVGNASLSQEKDPGIWHLSNVAVLPEFRGRGIAGQLVDTAVAHVRRHQGKRIMLQVRSENTRAVVMYRRRGFSMIDVLHELNLPPGNWPVSSGNANLPLRQVRAQDWRALYQLVIASTRPEVLRGRPVRARQFRRGLIWRARQCLHLPFSGERLVELVGVRNDEIVAYGSMILRLLRGHHGLELYVLPDERGRWESGLVDTLLWLAPRTSRAGVRCYVSSSHAEALQALAESGFETLRVLNQMSLELI